MNDDENGASNAPGDEEKQDQDGKTNDELLIDKHEALLAPFRAKYDEIALFVPPKGFEHVGLIVVAAPLNPKVFQNFVNQVSKDTTDKAVASENFALTCVVHPDRETAKSIFKKKPATALKICGRAQELAGADAKELGKD
jgi:hypothetical protein